MSDHTQLELHLLRTYGPRLNIRDLACVLKVAPTSLHNMATQNKFPVPSYIDGGRRYVDYRDVAAYLNARRPVEITQ